jgi:ubiquitin carboxyl-terminal hydrolase 10
MMNNRHLPAGQPPERRRQYNQNQYPPQQQLQQQQQMYNGYMHNPYANFHSQIPAHPHQYYPQYPSIPQNPYPYVRSPPPPMQHYAQPPMPQQPYTPRAPPQSSPVVVSTYKPVQTPSTSTQSSQTVPMTPPTPQTSSSVAPTTPPTETSLPRNPFRAPVSSLVPVGNAITNIGSCRGYRGRIFPGRLDEHEENGNKILKYLQKRSSLKAPPPMANKA